MLLLLGSSNGGPCLIVNVTNIITVGYFDDELALRYVLSLGYVRCTKLARYSVGEREETAFEGCLHHERV